MSKAHKNNDGSYAYKGSTVFCYNRGDWRIESRNATINGSSYKLQRDAYSAIDRAYAPAPVKVATPATPDITVDRVEAGYVVRFAATPTGDFLAELQAVDGRQFRGYNGSKRDPRNLIPAASWDSFRVALRLYMAGKVVRSNGKVRTIPGPFRDVVLG